MSVQFGPPPPQSRRDPDGSDLRVAVGLAVGLALVGALLGLLWSAWSSPGPSAEVLGGDRFAILDETESPISADGRFLILVVAAALVAALLAWFLLRGHRGPTVLLGLCVGAAGGGLLTELVGHLTGGGSFSGAPYRLSDGSRRDITLHLPLSLHIQGLLLIAPAVVALVYGLFVAFAVRDDLGRPDPVRDSVHAARAARVTGPQPVPAHGGPSVHAGDYPQYGGGYRDAAGPLQQRDLPPQ